MYRYLVLFLLCASPVFADVTLTIGNSTYTYTNHNAAVDIQSTWGEPDLEFNDGDEGATGTQASTDLGPTDWYAEPTEPRSHYMRIYTNGAVRAEAYTISDGRVTLAPGANYMYATGKAMHYWFGDKTGTWSNTSFSHASQSTGNGKIRYRNTNGGWIKVKIQCVSSCPIAAIGGITPDDWESIYDYYYRVYTDPTEPSGPETSTVNTAGHLNRKWTFEQFGLDSKSYSFNRHNQYGSMVEEGNSSTWTDSLYTPQSHTDYAVFYVPNNAYFFLNAVCTSDAITGLQLEEGSGVVNESSAKIQIVELTAVNASQVPTEWGGTMTGKPSPNTSVP